MYPLFQNRGTEWLSEKWNAFGRRFNLSRHQQHFGFGPLEKDLLPQLQSIQIRHVHVTQESMDRTGILARDVQSLFAVIRSHHEVPSGLKHFPSDVAEQNFIVRKKNH